MKKTNFLNKKTFSFIQWGFSVLGLFMSLYMFKSGGFAIIGGILILISAFIISPISYIIPILNNNLTLKTILRFIVSFILCVTGCYFATETNENEDTLTVQNIIETTTVPQTTTSQTTTSTITTITTSTTTSTTSTSTSTTTSTTTITTTLTTTVPTTAQPVVTTIVYTQPPTDPPAPKLIHFVLNTESNCVHVNENCSAAKKILPENWLEIDIPESELGNYYNVYWACGKCSSRYKNELPKFD